jgi:predicted MFS family arabinose efflux permease
MDASHRRAITLLSFAAFASAASLRVCDPLLPVFAREFDTTLGHAAHTISSFSIAYGFLQIVYGPMGDRFGKYRLVAWAVLACTIGGLGVILAPSIGTVVVFRTLTGATAAGIIPMSMAWIGDNVEYSERQAILARFLTGQIVGFASGQLIGGIFADTLGWRWGFALLVVIYIGVGTLLLNELRRNPQLDQHARKAPEHVVEQMLAVLRLSWARRVLATVFLEGMAVFGVLAFVPSDLHARFGISLTVAGAVLGTYGVGGLVFALSAKRFVRRLGESGLSATGCVLLALGLASLVPVPSWVLAIPGCIAIGLGFYMLHNTLQTNATQMAPSTRGTAVALFASAFFLGQAAGVALVAALVDRWGAQPVYLLAAVILPLLGFSFAHRLRRRRLAPA